MHTGMQVRSVAAVLADADLVCALLTHSEIRVIGTLGVVCSLFRSASRQPFVWSAVCEREWPGVHRDEVRQYTTVDPLELVRRLHLRPKLWSSLTHSGMQVAPAYQPHHVPVLYDGQPVRLSAEQEEMATLLVKACNTFKPVPPFGENFMVDWRPLLQECGSGHSESEASVIEDLHRCSFTQISEHLQEVYAARRDAARAAMLHLPIGAGTAARRAHVDSSLADDAYTHAIVDGVSRRREANSIRLPDARLFGGPLSGHPWRGRLSRRVLPEDVTLNLGRDAPVPPVPDCGDGRPHAWGGVVCDPTVPWLARWTDPLSGNVKYARVLDHESAAPDPRVMRMIPC